MVYMMTVTLSKHAIERMALRTITPMDVRHVLEAGQTIAELRDANRDPQFTMLGWIGARPLHVIYAQLGEAGQDHRYVITAYQPNPELWNADFTRRLR
jgi:hypothetical protein